ncbi:MAG: glycosyltransferase family 2 protein [Polyangiaceae bacterium]|nr:glycosyltransferase family 2 protein [Polyangiaceae bacterium]
MQTRDSDPRAPNDGAIPQRDLTIIAPCFNEDMNVHPLVARMLAMFETLPIDAELILVDDGSRDATWQKIQEEQAKHDRVRGFHHEKNKGIVGGWRTGLAGSRSPLVCLIDSDLQNRPEDIPRLYDAYESERPDLVQAVRHPKVNKNRIAFSKGLNFLLNATFGMHLRDNKSGFILCKREVLDAILADADGYRYFQSFIGVAAGVRQCRIVEVDTDFDARHAGESFLSNFPIQVSLRICKELLQYRVDTLRNRREPRPGADRG